MPNSTKNITAMANAIRALAMDAVQQANSGHPGAPMGMADMAVALWGRHLRHNPAQPQWADRDRFVLSNGHASMLIYSLLHLTGYDLSIDDLKAFRQMHSKTPGHPEVGITPGVETTTGPLGQGITNAVGMALAEKMLASEFNRDGQRIVMQRVLLTTLRRRELDAVGGHLGHDALVLVAVDRLGLLDEHHGDIALLDAVSTGEARVVERVLVFQVVQRALVLGTGQHVQQHR